MFFIFSFQSIAQNGFAGESEMRPIRASLDELLNSWYIGKLSVDTNTSSLNKYGFKHNDIPLYADRTYKKRLNALQSPIPLGYNPVIKRFIELYVKDKRVQVENMLGLSHYYFPIFEAELARHNLPLELKYIPVIESAINTHAVSRSGATGLWQFIYSTAKMYDLEITSNVDERRDPFVLTETAVQYLEDLYSIYKDWLYVIAAYNCGPGSVNKAIKRSGYKSDFWDIYPYLPNETRGYVPAFIAANYVMNYYIEHNLYPKNIYNPGYIDTIHINKRLRFEVISKALKISTELLHELNPQYLRNLIPMPKDGEYYILRLPISEASRFTIHRSRIFRYQTLLDEKEKLKVDNASKVKSISYGGKRNKNELTLILYNVKPGDTKYKISSLYDCSVSDLNKWNNFPGGIIKPGKTVNVYVPKSSYSKYKNVNFTKR